MTEEVSIFNPKLPQEDHRRSEWVTISGGRICVREMNARDSLFVLDHSQRPAAGPAGMSLSPGSIQTWQVVVSCYNGEGSDAKRIFEITDLEVIHNLRVVDWRKILDAIERVNSLADEEIAALRDFTPAERDGLRETSPSGVSRPFTGSLQS